MRLSEYRFFFRVGEESHSEPRISQNTSRRKWIYAKFSSRLPQRMVSDMLNTPSIGIRPFILHRNDEFPWPCLVRTILRWCYLRQRHARENEGFEDPLFAMSRR